MSTKLTQTLKHEPSLIIHYYTTIYLQASTHNVQSKWGIERLLRDILVL